MKNPLEEDRSWEILIFLYSLEKDKDKEKRKKSVIINNLEGSSGTFKKRFDELDKSGLIYIEESSEFPFKAYVHLTEKGKIVAKHLIEIEKIMRG